MIQPTTSSLHPRPSPPIRRFTLINEERHRKKQTEPRSREQRPDLRVQGRQTRDERIAAHSTGHRHGGLVARGFSGRNDLVDLGHFGDEDEVD